MVRGRLRKASLRAVSQTLLRLFFLRSFYSRLESTWQLEDSDSTSELEACFRFIGARFLKSSLKGSCFTSNMECLNTLDWKARTSSCTSGDNLSPTTTMGACLFVVKRNSCLNRETWYLTKRAQLSKSSFHFAALHARHNAWVVIFKKNKGVCVCLWVCVCVCVCACTFLFVWVYMYVEVCIFVLCMYVYICTYVYARTYTHIHTHTHTHTNTHTNKHKLHTHTHPHTWVPKCQRVHQSATEVISKTLKLVQTWSYVCSY